MSEPIMMPEHWPTAWQSIDLTVYRSGMLYGPAAAGWIAATLTGPDPAAVWGLSDGDIAWWAWDALAANSEIDRFWLDCLANTSGLHFSDRDRLWPLFDEACQASIAWTLQRDWPVAERFTHQALAARNVQILESGLIDRGRIKMKVDCNEAYRLHARGMWWPILANRRLAIVSNIAQQVAAKLLDRDFVSRNEGAVSWSIGPTVSCPPVSVPKADHLSRILDELSSDEWDLLVCAAGGLSAILCEHAKRIGRKAIDIGAFDSVLLGGPHNIAVPML